MLFASALCERDDLSTSSESCGCKPAASQPSARPLSLWDLKLFEHEEAPRLPTPTVAVTAGFRNSTWTH
eukprot:2380668-Rhodomonas_salina.3